jgi:hypothetical protein
MANGWPEGTMGEALNEPLNERQFIPTGEKKNKPIPIRKQGTGQHTKDVNKMASRVEASTNAATPAEHEAGKTFYYGYNRAGRQIAMGVNPDSAVSKLRDIPQASDTAAGSVAPHSAAGPSLHSDVGHETATRNAIAAIARMSPSQPRGMTWEKNPRAAFELSNKSDEEVDQMVKAPNLSVRQHGMLAHVGGTNIAKAHEILQGRSAPSDVIETGKKKVKVGTFFENGLDPWGARGATIDARSHDIAAGKRRGWEDVDPATGKKDDTRRIGSKGRYDMIEQAHQVAADRMGLQPHQVQAISWLADSRDSLGTNKRAKSRATLQTPVGQ